MPNRGWQLTSPRCPPMEFSMALSRLRLTHYFPPVCTWESTAKTTRTERSCAQGALACLNKNFRLRFPPVWSSTRKSGWTLPTAAVLCASMVFDWRWWTERCCGNGGQKRTRSKPCPSLLTTILPFWKTQNYFPAPRWC